MKLPGNGPRLFKKASITSRRFGLALICKLQNMLGMLSDSANRSTEKSLYAFTSQLTHTNLALISIFYQQRVKKQSHFSKHLTCGKTSIEIANLTVKVSKNNKNVQTPLTLTSMSLTLITCSSRIIVCKKWIHWQLHLYTFKYQSRQHT